MVERDRADRRQIVNHERNGLAVAAQAAMRSTA
jgi:hypothetical protein